MPEAPAPAAPVPEVPGPFDYVVVACPDCGGDGRAFVVDLEKPDAACGGCAGIGLVKRPVGQAGGRADG